MTLQFSTSELSLLKELQRNTSRDTYQKLATLIMLYNKLSQQFIAEMLGVDRTTFNRHCQAFLSASSFEGCLSMHYRPCMFKLSTWQLEGAKAYVSSHVCSTASEVAAFIARSFQIGYSESGAKALLHWIGSVYKKTKLVPSKADAAKQAAFVEQFGGLEKALGAEEVILLGMAYTRNTTRRHHTLG